MGGCDQNPLTTTTLYDRGLELVTLTVTPSGAISRFTFDAFGRLTSAFAPDPKTGAPSTEPSLTREYRLGFPLSRVHQSARDGAGYHQSWSYMDSLGETVLTLSEADPSKGDKGAWIASGLSLVSAKGLVTRVFDPWFYDGDPEQVPFTTDLTRPSQQAKYDAFGRVTGTWGYDQSPTSGRVYHALSEDLWDASDLDPQSSHGIRLRRAP
jgi:YD repeat-containing protein